MLSWCANQNANVNKHSQSIFEKGETIRGYLLGELTSVFGNAMTGLLKKFKSGFALMIESVGDEGVAMSVLLANLRRYETKILDANLLSA